MRYSPVEIKHSPPPGRRLRVLYHYPTRTPRAPHCSHDPLEYLPPKPSFCGAKMKWRTAEMKWRTAKTKWRSAKIKWRTAKAKWRTAKIALRAAKTVCQTAEIDLHTAKTIWHAENGDLPGADDICKAAGVISPPEVRTGNVSDRLGSKQPFTRTDQPGI